MTKSAIQSLLHLFHSRHWKDQRRKITIPEQFKTQILESLNYPEWHADICDKLLLNISALFYCRDTEEPC